LVDEVAAQKQFQNVKRSYEWFYYIDELKVYIDVLIKRVEEEQECASSLIYSTFVVKLFK